MLPSVTNKNNRLIGNFIFENKDILDMNRVSRIKWDLLGLSYKREKSLVRLLKSREIINNHEIKHVLKYVLTNQLLLKDLRFRDFLYLFV